MMSLGYTSAKKKCAAPKSLMQSVGCAAPQMAAPKRSMQMMECAAPQRSSTIR